MSSSDRLPNQQGKIEIPLNQMEGCLPTVDPSKRDTDHTPLRQTSEPSAAAAAPRPWLPANDSPRFGGRFQPPRAVTRIGSVFCLDYLEKQKHNHQLLGLPGKKKKKEELEDDSPESIFPQVLIQPRRHLFTSASVSARGDAQCACSSSYERKHGSARSHIFSSVKPRRVKLVKLETNYKQKEKQSIAKLTRRPQFLQSTLAQLISVQDGSAQLGSVKVGSTQATFREWLCATGSVQVGSARVCSRNVVCTNCAARFLTKVVCASCIVPGCCAQVALCKLLHASALCKLLCASALSKLLCASALGQLLRASALRMCSVQVGLCKLLCASALCQCSAQVALRKLLCPSDSAQVALRKCCRSCGKVLRVLFLYLKVVIFQPELRECAPRTTFVLKSCDFPAGAAGARSAYYVCT